MCVHLCVNALPTLVSWRCLTSLCNKFYLLHCIVGFLWILLTETTSTRLPSEILIIPGLGSNSYFGLCVSYPWQRDAHISPGNHTTPTDVNSEEQHMEEWKARVDLGSQLLWRVARSLLCFPLSTPNYGYKTSPDLCSVSGRLRIRPSVCYSDLHAFSKQHKYTRMPLLLLASFSLRCLGDSTQHKLSFTNKIYGFISFHSSVLSLLVDFSLHEF